MKNIRNKVQLIGNVGEDPQLETTKNGFKYVKLSIATNNTYTNKEGEKVKDTQWHPVLFWGKKAEITKKYVVKGQEIYVEGSLNYRNYDDDNRNKKYLFEIISNELLLLNK